MSTLTPDQLAPVFRTRDTLLSLAKMMAACQDVKQLAEVERFITDLIDGRVEITDRPRIYVNPKD